MSPAKTIAKRKTPPLSEDVHGERALAGLERKHRAKPSCSCVPFRNSGSIRLSARFEIAVPYVTAAADCKLLARRCEPRGLCAARRWPRTASPSRCHGWETLLYTMPWQGRVKLVRAAPPDFPTTARLFSLSRGGAEPASCASSTRRPYDLSPRGLHGAEPNSVEGSMPTRVRASDFGPFSLTDRATRARKAGAAASRWPTRHF